MEGTRVIINQCDLLEQENQELKAELETSRALTEAKRERIDVLQAELDEMKG